MMNKLKERVNSFRHFVLNAVMNIYSIIIIMGSVVTAVAITVFNGANAWVIVFIGTAITLLICRELHQSEHGYGCDD